MHSLLLLANVPGVPLAVRSCVVDQERWVQLHLAVRSYFNSQRWTCMVTQPIQCTHFWPAGWLSAVD